MKICPFISHLLGDENSNTLTLNKNASGSPSTNESGDVVILGYNDRDGSEVQTGVLTETESGVNIASHVECLKESCRFYKKDSAECQFEIVFAKLSDADSKATAPKTPDLSKDIDKIWKFQTKGVAEIVESFADSERKQSDSLARLKEELDRGIQKLGSKIDESSLEDIQKEIDSLLERIEGREEGFETLSETISKAVANVGESIAKLTNVSNDVSKRVDELKNSLPDESSLERLIEKSLDNTNNNLTAFDLTTPIRALEHKIEEIKNKQQDATEGVEKKLLTAIQTQKDLEEQITSWKEELTEMVSGIKPQHEEWEKRIGDLVENNKQISEYLEEGNRRRKEEQTRLGKKESKKYNNLGVTSFHNGAYELAKDQFLQAVKLDPEFSEAYNNLGLAYTELDQDEKATEAFGRAVELCPSLHAAYNNLGYIYYKQGNYEHAIEMYNEALGRNTKNGPAYTNLGNAYYRMGRMDDAREAWIKALELDPGNDKARRNLERISEDTD
ncbi:MAG: tetratricopeptide repeat protein [Candidatus Latescibacterota bacterium]|nr:MAG: tetratricopeptide repeat protein [Candidatus Latescibacterota bacterium]